MMPIPDIIPTKPSRWWERRAQGGVNLNNNSLNNVLSLIFNADGTLKPGSDSTTAFQFQNAAGNSTVLNIDTTNERVGIGTISPAGKLEVVNSGVQEYGQHFYFSASSEDESNNADVLSVFGGKDTDDYDLLKIENGGGAGVSSVTKFVIRGTGTVGINTTSPAGLLEAEVDDGDNKAGIVIDQNDVTNNPYGLEIQNAGTGDSIHDDSGAKLTAGGTWTDSSDIGFKLNIQDLGYGLDEVMKLKPKQFVYKRNGEPGVGLIAQDVINVIPEIVKGEEGNYSLAYGQLTAVLIRAIQQQQQQIQILQQKVM